MSSPFSPYLTQPIQVFIDHLVARICPTASPSQIDHLIIKTYLSVVLSSACLLGAIKLYLLSFRHPPPLHHAFFPAHPQPRVSEWMKQCSRQTFDPDTDQLVDVFLDLNSYRSSNLSIHSILHQLRIPVTLCQVHQPNRLVWYHYRCYADLTDQATRHLVSQLEEEAALNPLADQSFEIIDTFPLTKAPSPDLKPLFTDLLGLLHPTPCEGLCVVSTSDVEIFTFGLPALRSFAHLPSLCFVKPPGCFLRAHSSSADFLFRWEVDHIVMEPDALRKPFETSGVLGHVDQGQFTPLVLLCRAYGPAGVASVGLDTLMDALKMGQSAWCAQSHEAPDQAVMKYLDSATSDQVIYLSPPPVHDDFHSSRNSVQVKLSAHLFTKNMSLEALCDSAVEDPAKAELGLPSSVPAEEDELTTTGSDSELEPGSKRSSARNQRVALLSSSPLFRESLCLSQTRRKHQQGSIEGGCTAEQPAKKKKKKGFPIEAKRISRRKPPAVACKSPKRPLKKKNNRASSLGGSECPLKSRSRASVVLKADQAGFVADVKASRGLVMNFKKPQQLDSIPPLANLGEELSVKHSNLVSERKFNLSRICIPTCGMMIPRGPLGHNFPQGFFKPQSLHNQLAGGPLIQDESAASGARFRSFLSPTLVNSLLKSADYPFPRVVPEQEDSENEVD